MVCYYCRNTDMVCCQCRNYNKPHNTIKSSWYVITVEIRTWYVVNVEITTNHTTPLNHHGMLLLYKYKTDVHILLHHTQAINLPTKKGNWKLNLSSFPPKQQPTFKWEIIVLGFLLLSAQRIKVCTVKLQSLRWFPVVDC